jgi:hypothetical protein
MNIFIPLTDRHPMTRGMGIGMVVLMKIMMAIDKLG